MLNSFLLILFGYIFSRGFFSFSSITLLIIAYIFFSISTFLPKVTHKIKSQDPAHIVVLLVILSTSLYGGLYQHSLVLISLSFILLGLAIVLSFQLLKTEQLSSVKRIWFYMFSIAIALRLLMIWSSPNPIIDVFAYLKFGALHFLSGNNPYSMILPQMYKNVVFDYYGYPPGTLLLTTPFVWLFKDPRYTFAAAEILTAFLILKINNGKLNKYYFSLMLLYNPMSLYVLEQSYMETLAILLLTLSIWLISKKKFLISAVIFGIALSTKQYLVFLIPLFYRLINKESQVFRLSIMAFAIFVCSAVILPFFIWNQSDFTHDVVTLQFSYPIRYEGLTFFSLSHRFGMDFNPLISGVAITISFILIYFRRKIAIPSFFYLSSLLFFSFFIFNKWAFVNYYYLISQLIIVGISFEPISRENH